MRLFFLFLIAMGILSCSNKPKDEENFSVPEPKEGLIPISTVEYFDEEMGGKPYDGMYSYVFSDVFDVGNFRFYVLNPAGTIYESCYIQDKRTNEFVDADGFGQYMNKTYFDFFVLEKQFNNTYLGSYYLGGGTLYESWEFEVLKVSDESVELYKRVRIFHRDWNFPDDIKTGGYAYILDENDPAEIEIGVLEGDLKTYNEINPMSEFDFGMDPDSVLIEAEYHLNVYEPKEDCQKYETQFSYHLDYLSEGLIVVGIEEIVKTGSWSYSRGSMAYKKNDVNWERLPYQPSDKDSIYFYCEPAYADRIPGRLLNVRSDTITGNLRMEFVQEYGYHGDFEHRRKQLLYNGKGLKEL